MTRKINILLSVILILCAVGFLYTFTPSSSRATGRRRSASIQGQACSFSDDGPVTPESV